MSDGQDRTHICSFCKIKGHYRGICEKAKQHDDWLKQGEEEQRLEYERRREREEEQREEEARVMRAQKSWYERTRHKEEAQAAAATDGEEKYGEIENDKNYDMGDEGDDEKTVKEGSNGNEAEVELEETSDGSIPCDRKQNYN